MGNSLVQWRAAIGGFCSRICSSGWGKSVSSKSKFSHASQLLLILQLMSITLIKEEVAVTANKVKACFLHFIQTVLFVLTYSVLSLTALSLFYSLNSVSECSSQYEASHGTLNQEIEENMKMKV